MEIPKWNEIPVSYRRSLRKYHQYLEKVNSEEESQETTQQEPLQGEPQE